MLHRRLSEARGISFYGGSGLFGEEKKTRVQREREDRWFDLFVTYWYIILLYMSIRLLPVNKIRKRICDGDLYINLLLCYTIAKQLVLMILIKRLCVQLNFYVSRSQ
jgi:hypothetical protein